MHAAQPHNNASWKLHLQVPPPYRTKTPESAQAGWLLQWLQGVPNFNRLIQVDGEISGIRQSWKHGSHVMLLQGIGFVNFIDSESAQKAELLVFREPRGLRKIYRSFFLGPYRRMCETL